MKYTPRFLQNPSFLKWSRRVGGFLLSGIIFTWLFFWYVSGTPLGLLRFGFTYFVASHVYMEPVAKTTLFEGMLQGLISSLGEPHSQYLTPQDYDAMRMQVSGTYSGVGIVIGKGQNGLEVVSAIEDTPAAKAGIKAGDNIVSIDGKRTASMSLEEASKLMRGAAGTQVVLGIRSGSETKNVTITRADITMPTVKGKMLQDGIGYIRISQFADQTGADFAKEYKALQAQGMKALILDLRNNPGGLLTAARDVSDYILPAGPIVTVKDRSGHTESYDSQGLEKQIPLVVLINKGSASASEIVAGAVQDEKAGTIIGTNSYGKGTVQVVLNNLGDQGIKVTIAKYHTPNDRVIDGIGIKPDITIELPKGASSEADDTQLQKAIEVLMTRLQSGK
ncbi:MAG: S41 family peptidase [Veillonella sp.]|nr:S41 family peptidase [Veillonella sp.]